jgi:hypothetical protein
MFFDKCNIKRFRTFAKSNTKPQICFMNIQLKPTLLLLAFICFGFVACEKALDILQKTGLTNEEITQGLKEALTVGTDTSVTVLSKTDGYYMDQAVKIFLPEEAQAIYSAIDKIPGGNVLLENTILSINRAAEDAAPGAKQILWNAVTGMTIIDGLTILNGADSAATTYLKGKTFDSLFVLFEPKIKQSLSKQFVGSVSAESAYTDLVNAYNTASLNGILWDQIKTNSLSKHVTQKGLDGLFLKVAVEEKLIRENPLHRISEILKKVFTKQ